MSGRVAVIVVALASLGVACTRKAPPPAASPTPSQAVESPTPRPGGPVRVLPDTSWTLTYIDERAWPVGDAAAVTLSFDIGRLGGFDGCNEYGARWRIAGNLRLEVSRLISTGILCSGEEAWVEDRLHKILSASPTVDLGVDELRLTALPEGVLTFAAVEVRDSGASASAFGSNGRSRPALAHPTFDTWDRIRKLFGWPQTFVTKA